MDKTNQFQKTYPPPEHGYIPGKNINEDNLRKLFMAAAKCDINALKLAISTTNLPFDVVTNDGQTLIHAVLKDMVTPEKSKYNVIEYLLINNAPSSVHDKNNITPLHLAAKYQYQSIIKLLLKYDADVNALDSSDMSPLHYLVQNNIRDCKKKKYVGDIIPKSENDIRPEDLQDLTLLIMEILNTKHFLTYVEHIRNIFKKDNLVEMYYDVFQREKAELLKGEYRAISGIGSPKTELELIRGNQKNFQNYKSNLIQHISDKIKLIDILIENNDPDVINDIDIKNPKEIVKLMNMEYDPKKYKNSEKILLDKHRNEVIGELNKMVEQIDEQIDETMLKNTIINNSTIKIIYENYYAELNKDQKYRGKIYNFDKRIIQDLLLDDFKNISVPDITVIHDDAYDGKFIKKDVFVLSGDYIKKIANQIRLFRRYSKDIPDDPKEKNKMVKLPLTEDHGLKIPNTNKLLILTDEYDTIAQYWDWANTQRNSALDDISIIFTKGADKEFYFYKLNYYIIRINFIWETIKENSRQISDLLTNNKIYNVYINVLISMYEGIFNILQNCLYLKNINKYNKLKAKDILDKFNEKFINTINSGHPYGFLIEAAKNNAEIILNTLNSIDKLVDDLYNYFNQLIDKLNSVIYYVNHYSFSRFASSIHSNDFKLDIVDKYENLFHKEIPPFSMLPQNFEKYEEIFGKSIPEARSYYYDLYAPKVNQYNYLIYLDDGLIKNNGTYNYSYGFDGNTRFYVINNNDGVGTYGKVNDERNRLAIDEQSLDKFQFGILYYNPYKFPQPNPGNISGKNSLEEYIKLVHNGKYIKNLEKYKSEKEKKVKIGTKELIFNSSDDYHGAISLISDIGSYNKKFALPIVKRDLSIHIYYLKHTIIKNLLDIIVKMENGAPTDSDELKDKVKRILKEIKEKEYSQGQISVYFTIVKLAEKFLDDFINTLISNGVTNYIEEKNDSSSIGNIFSDVFKINDRGEILKDTKFSFNFNEFFKTIINTYLKSSTSKLTDDLLYTMNLINDEEGLSEQFIIDNTNYDLEVDTGVQKCYKVKPQIVDMMVKYGADVNLPDITKSTPIYYAIVSLNKEIIGSLIKNGANVVLEELDHVSNNPYFHFVNLFRAHIGVRKPSPENFIQHFTKRMTKRIKDEITNDDDLKNNVIKFIENIFPQMIFMYNHLFYFYMKSYINGWSYDDNKELEKFFIECGCINMDGDFIDYQLPINKNIVENADKYISVTTLNSYKKKINKETKMYNDNIKNYNSMLTSLENEKNDLTTKGVIGQEIKNINIKISEIKKKLADLEVLYNNKKNNDMKNIEENINNQIGKFERDLQKNKSYHDKKNININKEIRKVDNPEQQSLNLYREPHIIYDDFFTHVISKSRIPSTKKYKNNYKDHMMYNASWENIILNKDDRVNNIHHIHLLTVNMYYRCLDRIKKIKNIKEIEKCNELFKLLKKLHESIFAPAIKYSKDLKQEYNFSKNHTLTAMIDIMIHVSKHIIFSNIYHGIIKVITKYMLNINPSEYIGNKEAFEIYKNNPNQYKEYIIKIVYSIVKDKGTKHDKLYKHIVETMPRKIVKMYMGVYEDGEKKVENKENEIDNLFEDITEIIISNTDISIKKDSHLIKMLDKYIYSYYKKIISIIIPKMKVVFDNYNRYIINEGKYMSIMVTLTKQYIKESQEIKDQKSRINQPIFSDSPPEGQILEELEG